MIEATPVANGLLQFRNANAGLFRMQNRPLGQTGMNVSVLSIGSSALGGVYHEYDDREGIAAIRTAVLIPGITDRHFAVLRFNAG